MKFETQIAKDLELCDLINALGDKASKRKATAHRKACFKALKEMSVADGVDALTDDELLAELGA